MTTPQLYLSFKANIGRKSFWLIGMLLIFVLGIILTGCGSGTKAGTVTGFGQTIPAGGGMVQSYVTVILDDTGEEVDAWLPQDDKIWTTMRQGASSGKIRVEVKYDGEFWRFVQIVPEE
jgi:hypothetical protein